MSRTKAFFHRVHEIAAKKVELLLYLDSCSSQREFSVALAGLERIDSEITMLAEEFGFPDDKHERRPEEINKIVDSAVHKELSKLDKKKQEEIKTNYKSHSPEICGLTTTDSHKKKQDSPCPSLPTDHLQYMHKNQLQIYAQKRKLNLPIFSWKSQGPPHNTHFKAMVTVDGQSFESPEFYHTLKEAEHAASKVALASLMSAGIPEDESGGFYKNFLQEFLLKEGLPFPTYKTKSCGAPHLPTFVSTVEVGTDVFEGIPARTKKQAEMNAAKVAYCRLKECKSSGSMISQAKDALQCTSSNSISSLTLDVKQIVKSEDPFVLTSSEELKKECNKGLSYKIGSYEDANLTKPIVDEGKLHPSVASSVNPGITSTMRNESDVIDARLQDPLPFSLSSTNVCVFCSLSPYHKHQCTRHYPAISSEEDLLIKREAKRAKTRGAPQERPDL